VAIVCFLFFNGFFPGGVWFGEDREGGRGLKGGERGEGGGFCGELLSMFERYLFLRGFHGKAEISGWGVFVACGWRFWRRRGVV